MLELGQLKRLALRTIWPREARDFTPWLANNLQQLGTALGMDLTLERQEASVGDFSLDLLCRDLNTSRSVIIENQLTPTDHDHLGKLLTYAAGFNAGGIIWIAESFREEHRQALDWLNQRTDTETHFFGVIVEVLQIDSSKPAFNFNPVVLPNEWQKTKTRTANTVLSSRTQAYRDFFQILIDELREKHHFTNARIAQPQSWFNFPSGISWIVYSTSFAQGGRVRVELYIDHPEESRNKALFNWLYQRRDALEQEYGAPLEWDRLDEKRASRVALYTTGSIDIARSEWPQIQRWMIENLLRFKKIFGPYLKQYTAGTPPSAPNT